MTTDSSPRQIAVRNLDTNEEEALYRVTAPTALSQFAVSPDGRHLAFVQADTATGASSLRVMPTTPGGPARELATQPASARRMPGFDARRGSILRPAWSPDGRTVLYTTLELIDDDGGFKLWRVTVDGGAPEDLGLEHKGLRPYGLSIHPDGRRIALTAGKPRRQESWVIDGLAQESGEPATKAALVGNWQGLMHPEGQPSRVEVEILQASDGKLSGRVDFRDAAVVGVPLAVEIEGVAVTMRAGRRPLIKGQLTDLETMNAELYVATMNSWKSLVLEKDNDAFRRFAVPRLNDSGNPERQYSYRPPAPMNGGWPVSTLSAEAKERLGELVLEVLQRKHGRPEAILIARNGKLVFEEYFYGFTRERLHPIQSVTKSITSLLFGIARDRGLIGSLDDAVHRHFGEYAGRHWIDEQYPVTLSHLLTMSAGVEWIGEGHRSLGEMTRTSDWIGHVLDLALTDEPGRVASYNSGLTLLLGAIIRSTAGMPVDRFAEQTLFADLGVTSYRWWPAAPDGIHNTFGGLHLSAYDLAKMGQVILAGGVWNEKQVVPRAWVDESVSERLPLGEESVRATGGSRYSTGYGYQWWHQRYDVDERSVDAIAGLGYGGQYLGIFPSLDVVIVLFNGEWGDPSERVFDANALVEQQILPAIK